MSPNPPPMTSTGRIDFGPDQQHDGLLPRTLDFIRDQLPAWRDDPRRPKKIAEKGLNSSLCDFLDVMQRKGEFPMVRFKHETPQTARATVDIGVHGLAEVTTVGTQSFGIYEPFMVIECKRLPTPGGKRREREYVSGFHENGSPTGGIQRFKLGFHGGNVEVAAMIGYIEHHDFQFWHRQINDWITEEVVSPTTRNVVWLESERLGGLDSGENTSVCASAHSRTGNVLTHTIQLRHIWIRMS